MNNSNLGFLLLKCPRKIKRFLVLSLDILFAICAVILAFYLRIDQWVPLMGNSLGTPLPAIVISIVVALPLFISAGFYRAIFRYSEFAVLKVIAKNIALYGLIYAFVFCIIGVSGVPRSVGLIQPILMLMFVGGSRILAAYWLGGMYRKILHLDAPTRLLIYGAGQPAREIAKTLSQNVKIKIVGFIENDATLFGGTLIGVPIYSSIEMKQLVKNLNVTDILLAIPHVGREERNSILKQLQGTGVSVRSLPHIFDLSKGFIDQSEVMELDIDDLLGRDPVLPSNDLLQRNMREENILITGAGGSIGSELCLQLLQQSPKKILLVEHSEYALYQILEKLQIAQLNGIGAAAELIPLLGSVQNQTRMNEIFSTWMPSIVFHAAAYKHVHIVEENPVEGVLNNVFGTLVIANMALKYKVNSMTLVSTDKAVRPTNIMGASKRIAEMILQAFSCEKSLNVSTKFSMVRFGNVLGSSGSVVPKFREQVQSGGPVTVTHPDVTRYFMTITEATQLVLQASFMSKGGEVFLLDMGDPVRIVDLAKRIIELSGCRVKDDLNSNMGIEIKYTGLRPGEKLYEELLIGDNPEETLHPRIMKSHEKYIAWNCLESKLNELHAALDLGDIKLVKIILSQLVDGYVVSESYAQVIQ